MFNPTGIVQSAVSSFNNAALFGPDFFWVFVLCLPIFVVTAMFASEIATRILAKDARERTRTIYTFSIAAMAIWLMTHGSYDALRDVSVAPIISALGIFVCFAFGTRSLMRAKFRLSKYIKAKQWIKKTADILAPLSLVAIAGFCGGPGWRGFALQGGAAMLGMLLGWVMNKLNRREYDAKLVAVLLMALITFGIAMQPEFFRFGQMGRLTAVHLMFLALTAAAITGGLAARFIKPCGWFTVETFKKIKIFSWLVAVLSLAMFLFTESTMMFVGFSAVTAVAISLGIVHQKNADRTIIQQVSADMFTISMGLFGVLSTMPPLVCAAIILWNITPHDRLIGIISGKRQ